MRKFVQLAEDVEADLKALDKDADELDQRRREVKDRARGVINNHHRIQDRIEEGIAAMEKVAEAAGLPNTTRTAAELAEIEAEEAAAKSRGEGNPNGQGSNVAGEASKLGEASGGTPGAPFSGT